jgi:hypothetical protein
VPANVNITEISKHVNADMFLRDVSQAATTKTIQALLARLPIVNEHEYVFDADNPTMGWKPNHFHWLPVGRDRGNAGRIRLAGRPINPLAERLVNGMEALIEMMRQRERRKTPDAPVPGSPREAVLRYFQLPPLDQIPTGGLLIGGRPAREHARELARQLILQLQWDKSSKEFTVSIHDAGIGQAPTRMHKTLLSLGSSDKGDKPYLIGLFGQGGSSTYAASKFSSILSRRAADLLDGESDGIGWTVVKHIIPRGRRDPYFAYLAAAPDGRVPAFPVSAAEAIGFKHGSLFSHLAYDFGGSASAITRNLYQALNHVLYNPVLPFDTDVAGTKATIYGNCYRLSNLATEKKDLDKVFGNRPIEAQ